MKSKGRAPNNATADTTEKPEYVLCLFITGASPKSTKALHNITSICEQYLQGRYTLQIVDIYQQAELARENQIIALPLLIKRSPLPERRLVGDMSETERVLKGLGIQQ